MRPTESLITETKLARIAWLSKQDHTKKFANLMHLFNEESFNRCYQDLNGGKATGIDRVDKEQYGKRLKENLTELATKMKQMAYRPGAVREVQIPKDDKPNATRTLGICNLEDKIVQKMMQKVLESIYEPLFLEQSFGFRPKRGCHDAIKALDKYLYQVEVETILDVDLENFFGSINHKLLLEILSKKILDKRFLRYIARSLKAGTLTNGDLRISDEGVVQGSVHGPILSNIIAHEVIDIWFEETVKPHCRGKVELVRYADDLLVCCRYEADAKRIMQSLEKRLDKYQLKMNTDKTKLVSFSKRGYRKGIKQGVFDFLGFTFYWGRSKKGFPILKLRTSAKKFCSKLKRVKAWVRKNVNHVPLNDLWDIFCVKLAGHIRYYGVSHNLRQVRSFIRRSERILFKWLNRRSQRKSLTWEKYRMFKDRHPLPCAKIYHQLF